jgi:hypothetical protein
MSSAGSYVTQLERAVLWTICERHVVDRAPLGVQLSTATVLNRTNTGAGFYTDFAVERVSSPAIGGERLRRGPGASVAGLVHGMGFILWLKEGYIDRLEGYSYDENTTAIDFERAAFEVIQD